MGKWAAFWLLGLIWGSSFLLIRVGVTELSPFQLVFIRTGIAAVGLNLVLLARGQHLPFNLRGNIPLIIIGIGNTALPFALITWGEKSVESGLASVLNSTAALFALVIAHFSFADERITPQKVVGLVTGFLGIVVLASMSWVDGQIVTGSLFGQLAIVGGAFCYGFFSNYSKRVLRGQYQPMMVSAGAMTWAAVVSGIAMVIAPLFNGQPPTPLNTLSADVLGSILLLGFLNTFIAYLMYYWIVAELGAARSSMVTYVTPPVGLALGVLILGEQLHWQLIVGAAMILFGIAVVNLRVFQRKPVTPEAELVRESAS